MELNNFYNNDVKEMFLNDIPESTHHTLKMIFRRSKNVESLYGEDLYNFSLNQISDVMRNINPGTENSAIHRSGLIHRYIDWAIKKGLRENNLNPLDGTEKDWSFQFIDKETKHLSEEQLDEIVDSLANAQDKALIQCLFEGIMGNEMAELINLKYNDVDWINNILTLEDKDGRKRKIKVSDRCIDLLDKANKQEVYQYVNRKSDVIMPERELVSSGYIFKNVKSKRMKDVTPALLRKRILVLREWFEMDKFSAMIFRQSGQIKMAVDLWEERGILDTDEFNEIGEKFNLKKMKHERDGMIWSYYNRTTMSYYINEKNIKKLYGIDVKITKFAFHTRQ